MEFSRLLEIVGDEPVFETGLLLAGEVGNGQQAFVATAEKALLDLVHLQPRGDAPEYLQQLRLQNLERLDLDKLQNQAARAANPKLHRAAHRIIELAEAETQEYEIL